MSKKPTFQTEILAIIERHGPITTASIATHLPISLQNINYHILRMGKTVHVSSWEPGRAKSGQSTFSRKWTAGPGKNAPRPKVIDNQVRIPVVVDLASMPYRSVFAGGVSPWAGMEA